MSTRPGAGSLWSVTIAADMADPLSDAVIGSLVNDLHAAVQYDVERRHVLATLPVRARGDFEAATNAVDRFSAVLQGAELRITEPVTCTACA